MAGTRGGAARKSNEVKPVVKKAGSGQVGKKVAKKSSKKAPDRAPVTMSAPAGPHYLLVIAIPHQAAAGLHLDNETQESPPRERTILLNTLPDSGLELDVTAIACEPPGEDPGAQIVFVSRTITAANDGDAKGQVEGLLVSGYRNYVLYRIQTAQ